TDHYLRFLGFSTLCFITISVLVLLQGCGLPEPKWERANDLELQGTWTNAGSDNQGEVIFGWLEEFEDPEMERLVAEVIERNLDLRVAAARLRVAKEGTILGREARLPRITASGSGSHFESNVKDSRLSLNVSWEIDLWGRLANLHQATIEDYEAELANYRGARLSLAANTAKAWCNLIAARQQVELAHQTRDSFQRNYRITERNYKAGDPAASSLDVNFGRNQVASAERALISRELARDEAKRSLELLLGRYPATSIEGREELPTLGRAVPAGLPSELLMRRPDLAAAAAVLRASAERASAARKGLLPSINLSAGGATTIPSLELLDLIRDPTEIAWSVAASITEPIYRGDAIRAQARQALALNDAAIATFSGIALRAFREVESALATGHSLAAQERFLETELQQANLAETQAYRGYSEGIVGILSVLEAQRRAFNARNSMISLRNGRIQNRINLHLVLGGDFETPPPSQVKEQPAKSVKRRFSMKEDSLSASNFVSDRH
ncbi:MAG: efflux transporter outer membrane subunit, partial [Actinomycetota bacterium]|nr:efflux transporter outer membrane subunit [Actinomycetota bacterium]